jgi:zinc protease
MIIPYLRSFRLGLVACVLWVLAASAWAKPDYAIVVSEKTQADAGWAKVVAALKSSHGAAVLVYKGQVEEVLPALRGQFPRYACFVAQPQEAGRDFVARVHRLTRQLDDDPYADCIWGILTGYNAASALRIAQCRKPLTVHKVASGTEVALEMCEEGQWYDELVKNKHVQKEKGGEARELKGPDDTTEAMVKTLTEYQADLFVASGHATERDWMLGYRYQNGFFRCENGVLYGLDTKKQKFPVQSPNPKVYMPVGNCLMGHVDGTNAMALAWMNSAGVNQMIGYTVPSWYGYAGWGCLDYFVEQPGRYTFAEAYFANQHALIYRLKTYFPGAESVVADANGSPKTPVAAAPAAQTAGLNANDLRGLLYDRDTVAFYGDPAWAARMAKGNAAWEQSLTEKKGIWTFTITPKRGEKTFAPINKNGSQRGGRPIIAYLPKRVKEVQVLAGTELHPVITDDFILVPNPQTCDPAKPYQVVFRAKDLK